MPRELALDILAEVLVRKQPLDASFDGHPRLAGLAPRDRAFARTLATTTLRRLGQIDSLVAGFLDKPLPKKASEAGDILRLGICQLLFLGTPAHAAVDTSVRLAEARRQGAYKKLVNAVLRRAGREGKGMVDAQDAPRLNTPDWLWESWTKAYGEETCRLIATAHLSEPPLDITLKGAAENWAERLGATPLATGSLRLRPKGPISDLPGFGEGAWWVQDAAAALPVTCLGDVRGLRVIDLCAAPGGKAAQLAARGAKVTAVDRSATRLRRLAQNMDRLGLAVDMVTADATEWRPEAPADIVFLDAPCTSTGTIRRHPDIARLRSLGDIGQLAAIQDALLNAAADMVRPGGVILYCTCSLQPEEGVQRAEAFLGKAVELVALGRDSAPGRRQFFTPEGYFASLPCQLADQGGVDGFFAAMFRRL